MRRSRPRTSRILFVLSMVLAVGTTMAIQARLARLEAQARAAGPGREVVVAAVDLDRGTLLEASMLSARRIPTRYLPPGALDSADAALGRTLAADVAADEPITEVRLGSPGGPVAALIPPGMRAVAVPAAIPASALRAGDRVDIHATFASGGSHTETVVAGAEVLTVLPGTDPGGTGAVTLIVLVGPESAERLAFARTFADLSVALVSASDGGPAIDVGTEDTEP
jgi:pilus assembly protein CpaB